jgi:hypothetical protein
MRLTSTQKNAVSDALLISLTYPYKPSLLHPRKRLLKQPLRLLAMPPEKIFLPSFPRHSLLAGVSKHPSRPDQEENQSRSGSGEEARPARHLH